MSCSWSPVTDIGLSNVGFMPYRQRDFSEYIHLYHRLTARLPLSYVGALQEKTKAMLPRIHVGHRIPYISHSLAAWLSHCGMRTSSGRLLVGQLAAEIMVPFACGSS